MSRIEHLPHRPFVLGRVTPMATKAIYIYIYRERERERERKQREKVQAVVLPYAWEASQQEAGNA